MWHHATFYSFGKHGAKAAFKCLQLVIQHRVTDKWGDYTRASHSIENLQQVCYRQETKKIKHTKEVDLTNNLTK